VVHHVSSDLPPSDLPLVAPAGSFEAPFYAGVDIDSAPRAPTGVRLEVTIGLADRVVQRALERLYPRLDATLYALVTFPAVRAGEEAGRRGVLAARRSLERLEAHYVRCQERLDALLRLDGEGPPVRLAVRRYRLSVRSPQAGRLLDLFGRADRLACGITRLWLHGRWDDAERARALYALVKKPLYTGARDLMRARARFLPPEPDGRRAAAAPASSQEG
jgi:hypothetical protein